MRKHKRFIRVVLAIAAAVALHQSAPGNAHPAVRHGTILGNVPIGGAQSCEYTPNCIAWREARCPKRLATARVAVGAAIVDVHTLAATDRLLWQRGPTYPWISAGVIEFWTRGCTRAARFDPQTRLVHVPADAYWLTIPSSSGPIEWSLS